MGATRVEKAGSVTCVAGPAFMCGAFMPGFGVGWVGYPRRGRFGFCWLERVVVLDRFQREEVVLLPWPQVVQIFVSGLDELDSYVTVS